jgi:hypothetical protein
MAGMDDVEAYSFIQTYCLNQGLKKFGELGRKAVHKEMQQLNDRVVFKPILIKDMTALESYFPRQKSEMEQLRQERVQTEARNAHILLAKKQQVLQRQRTLSSSQE